jgi:hypothetical protein
MKPSLRVLEDPDRPKRSLSSYVIFCMEERAEAAAVPLPRQVAVIHFIKKHCREVMKRPSPSHKPAPRYLPPGWVDTAVSRLRELRSWAWD